MSAYIDDLLDYDFNTLLQGYVFAYNSDNEICKNVADRLERSGSVVRRAHDIKSLTRMLTDFYNYPDKLNHTVLVLLRDLKDCDAIQLIRNLQEWLPFRKVVVLENEDCNHKTWYAQGVVPIKLDKPREVYKKLRSLLPKNYRKLPVPDTPTLLDL